MFWPESDDHRGRNALRQLLHVLRKDLGPDVVVTNGDDELAVRAAKNLAHTAEGGRLLPDALYWWRKALELNTFDEGVVRRVMALLAGSGNRCQALAECNRFRCRMESGLEVQPSRETQELADLISSDALDRVPVWVGDRRGRAPESTGNHWRRPEDGALT